MYVLIVHLIVLVSYCTVTMYLALKRPHSFSASGAPTKNYLNNWAFHVQIAFMHLCSRSIQRMFFLYLRWNLGESVMHQSSVRINPNHLWHDDIFTQGVRDRRNSLWFLKIDTLPCSDSLKSAICQRSWSCFQCFLMFS